MNQQNLEINNSPNRSVSIPSRYEIIRIKNKEINGFSRRTPRFKRAKKEIPGPGEYLSNESTLAKKSTSMSEKGYGHMCSSNPRFGNMQRRTFNPPGPGDYSLPTFINSSLTKNKNRVHGSSGFVLPRSTSLHFYRKKRSPGPGQYNPTLPKTRGATLSSSSFRSQTIRPFLKDRKRKKKKKGDPNPLLGRKGFGAKEKRCQGWELESGGMQVPEKKRLIKRMKRKKKGVMYSDNHLSNSVFRSTSKRGAYSNREKFPGPGAYEKRTKKGIGIYNMSNTMFLKPSYSFASNGKLDRFGKSYLTKLRRKKGNPGPGHYHPGLVVKERNNFNPNKSSMFASSSNRFRKFENQTKMGPGDYDPLAGRKSFHLNYQKVWI